MSEEQNGAEQSETVNILDRAGAIEILRDIRRDIKAIGEAGEQGFTLAPTQKQIEFLKVFADRLNAQVFAIAVVLARMLDDPLLEDEINADLEVLDAEQTP